MVVGIITVMIIDFQNLEFSVTYIMVLFFFLSTNWNYIPLNEIIGFAEVNGGIADQRKLKE